MRNKLLIRKLYSNYHNAKEFNIDCVKVTILYITKSLKNNQILTINHLRFYNIIKTSKLISFQKTINLNI